MTHMAQQHTVVWRVEYSPKAFKLSKISVDSADQAELRDYGQCRPGIVTLSSC